MKTLIKNARLLDGSSSHPISADLLIKDGFIASIGNLSTYKDSDQIIEANQNFIAPGFISLFSSADSTNPILTNRLQSNSLKQGITTLIIGQTGFSLAPILSHNLSDFFSSQPEFFNLNWHSFSEFKQQIKNHRFGPNFYSLISHLNLFSSFSDSDSASLENFTSFSLRSGSPGVSFDLQKETGSEIDFLKFQSVLAGTFKENRLASLFLPPSQEFRQKIILTSLREKRKAQQGKILIANATDFDDNYLKRSRSRHEVFLFFNSLSPIHSLKLIAQPRTLVPPTLSLLKYTLTKKPNLLPQVIKHLTSYPAEILNLPTKHILKESEPADLISFNNSGSLEFSLVSGQSPLKDSRLKLTGQALFL